MSLILDGTNGLSDIDGSAATPAIRGTDTNTGIFFPAADTIAFSEGGAESMRLDSAGNVGIGTSSPSSYSFDTGVDLVVGDGNNSAITVVSSATGTGYLAFADGTTTTDRYSGLIEYNHTSNYLGLRTASIERMRITSAGNVGIGTTTPNTKLEIAGDNNGATSNNTLRFTDTDTSSAASQQTGKIEFYTSDSTPGPAGVTSFILSSTEDTSGLGALSFGTGQSGSAAERLRIDSAGNVGIGTSSPAAKLVSAGSSATNFKALILRNGDGTTSSSASIDFEASTGTQGDEASMAGRIAGVRTGSGTSGALTFSTTSSGVLGERMRIDSAGAILYAAGVYPYSHRRTTISVAAAATVTLFDLWGGNQGRGQYLVSVTRTGGSIATRAVAIVGSSTSSVSTVNDVLASTAVTIGVSGSSVTATNTGGATINIVATAVPLVIDGN